MTTTATKPVATREAIRTLTASEIDAVSGGSFDIEQTISIGSGSSGAGAGKATFGPFH